MKFSRNLGLAFAAPLLILISLLGLLQRKGNDRLQALPALTIGIGLISTSAFQRQQSRKKILSELRQSNQKNDV